MFLHGLLGSGTNFRSFAMHPSLRDKRRVLTIDMRNHGRSPHSNGPIPLAVLVDDVALTLQSLGLNQATIVGHSLGGRVAALLALRHPEAVKHLIVMDIALSAYHSSHADWGAVRNVVEAAVNLDVTPFTHRKQIDEALKPAIPDAGMRSFLQQNLVATPSNKYRWRIDLPSIQASLPSYATFPASPPHGGYAASPLAQVDFIAGGNSRFLLPEHHAAVKAFFPAAQFHSVAGAGHWIHADKPAEFLQLMRAILR